MANIIDKQQLYTMMFTIGLIIIDFFTGFFKALLNKEFKSSKMRDGGKHKLSELLSIGLGFMLDATQLFGFSILPFNVSYPIMYYISLMEICSIVENCKLTLPTDIKHSLEEKKEELGGDHNESD